MASVRALLASSSAAVVARGSSLRRAVSPWVVPVRDRVLAVWSTFTAAGRAVVLLVVVTWLLAWRFGWQELSVVAAAGLLLLGLAALFTIGRTHLAVSMSVDPPRVTVGEDFTGSIHVTNLSRTPLLPLVLELPTGEGAIGFDLPLLRQKGTYDRLFIVEATRRGVMPVGPVTSVRGDPVGVFRRDVAWTEVVDIFVHPRIVQLAPLGSGLVRDLEGITSETVSRSDLAFHALREYVPGDDLRHVHWRSSARHNTLLVRQFLDTRRSHVSVVVDCVADSYRSDDDYETAVSVAGSILTRAVLDVYDITFLSGSHAMTRGTRRAGLDACSRAEPGTEGIVQVSARGSRLAPDTSVVFLVTGPETSFIALQRSAAQYPVDVVKIAVVVDSDAQPSLRSTGELPLMTIPRLEDLPGMLRWGLS